MNLDTSKINSDAWLKGGASHMINKSDCPSLLLGECVSLEEIAGGNT